MLKGLRPVQLTVYAANTWAAGSVETIVMMNACFAKQWLCIVLCFVWMQFMAAAQEMTGRLQLADSGFVFAEAPFKSCHASTILPLGKDHQLAAWFAGPHEGHKEVSIYTSRFQNGQWSVPEMVATGVVSDSLRYPCWNPVLVQNASGKVLLFYKVGPNPREWWGMVMQSDDGGRHWGTPQKLPNDMLGPIKNKSLLMKDGSFLHPSSTESLDEKTWTIHVEQSDGDARHWQRMDIDCDSFGVIQPSFLVHPNGNLQLLSRSRQKAIVSTFSKDGGKSWSPLQALDLPNPNSGSDALTLQDGRHLLVYNPMQPGKDWWEGRSVLSVALSSNGRNWTPMMNLEEHASGEYSYPAVVQDAQGDIWITYTYNRKNIKYVRLRIQ